MHYAGTMNTRTFSFALLMVAMLLSAPAATSQSKAPTPPMGWDSFGAYGFSIDEAQFRANAAVLAGIQQFGWKYAILAPGWYMGNPAGRSLAERKFQLNAAGVPVPDPVRFPSSTGGVGLRPLGNWLHQQGLKFGLHVVSGIPRDAVRANLPVAGTGFHAAEAADTSATCPGDDSTYGVADNAAGQAFLNSMFRLYAGWGVDLVRVDCIGGEPYNSTAIKQIAHAIQSSGRPIVLSLSSGAAPLDRAAEIQESAQLWQIVPAHTDVWEAAPGSAPGSLAGVRPAFDLFPKWFTYSGPDAWPDAGMLTGGWLEPNPANGKARQSGLSADEERSELAFWAIVRSPLILGANLTRLDDTTRALVSNQDLLFMNQSVTYSRPLDTAAFGAGLDKVRVWRATFESAGVRGYAEYYGFFNLDDRPATIHATWSQLGLDNAKHSGQNLWDDSSTKLAKDLTVTLPAHGSAIFKVN